VKRSNTPKGNRGAAYIRVSDGEKQDPQRQRETVQRWAANRGLLISRLAEDFEGRNLRAKAERQDQDKPAGKRLRVVPFVAMLGLLVVCPHHRAKARI
jgi:hypothetical protein